MHVVMALLYIHAGARRNLRGYPRHPKFSAPLIRQWTVHERPLGLTKSPEIL
jgi:hypothetical protein